MAKSDLHEERVTARKNALQIMYQAELLDKKPMDLVSEKLLVPETSGLSDYATDLLSGCQDNLEAIDKLIVEASVNWTMDRMPIVDRSLLRLTTYEMLHVEDVPVSVSINEAVNMAKEFGGEDSPRFINGILGRIAKQLEEE